MALSLAACGTQKRETLELFAMDTYMTFVAIGDGADDVLTDLSRTVNTLESSLSRTVDTSEVSRLNRDGSAVWDEDGAQLLSWALQHSQETDGAFDITIAPLVELWGRTQQKYTQLRKLLKRYDNLVTQINHEIASYIQSEDQHG